eukprot:INCI10004.2.p1 GENE.INCI10004.2~~INCI10004.2.p1  ORF type:complete len:517 (+),score=58.08 INCI10004.2:67-1617(+)
MNVVQFSLLLQVALAAGVPSENDLGSEFSTRSFKVPGLLDSSINSNSNWLRAFSPLVAWESVSLRVEVEPLKGGDSKNATESIGVVLDQCASYAVLGNFFFGSAFVHRLGMPSCQLSEVLSNPARIKLRDHRLDNKLPLAAQHPEQCLIAGSDLKCSEVTANRGPAPETHVEQQFHPRYECQVMGIPVLPNPSLSIVSLPGRPCFGDFICFDRVPFRVASLSSGPTATSKTGFDVANSYLLVQKWRAEICHAVASIPLPGFVLMYGKLVGGAMGIILVGCILIFGPSAVAASAFAALHLIGHLLWVVCWSWCCWLIQVHNRPFSRLILHVTGLGFGDSIMSMTGLLAAGVDLGFLFWAGAAGIRYKREIGIFEKLVVARREAIGERRFYAETIDSISLKVLQGAAALASLAMMAGSTNEPAVPLAWLLAFYASRYFYLLRQRQSTIAASLLYQKAAELRLGGFKTSAQVQSEAEEFTRNELESLRVYLRRNRKVVYTLNRKRRSHVWNFIRGGKDF